MPRRNKRDKRYEPREYDTNQSAYGYDAPSVSKPKRKRKDKGDKKIYRNED